MNEFRRLGVSLHFDLIRKFLNRSGWYVSHRVFAEELIHVMDEFGITFRCKSGDHHEA